MQLRISIATASLGQRKKSARFANNRSNHSISMRPSTANDQKSGSVERSTSNSSHDCSDASRLATLLKILDALDRAIEEREQPQKDPSPPRSRPISPTSGGPAPDWLGKPGFDVQTAARAKRIQGRKDYLSGYPFPSPIFTDDEEQNDEELAAFKGRAIEYSKSMVFESLDWYEDLVGNGSLEVKGTSKRPLRRIIKEAKGKKPQRLNFEEIDFVSWLHGTFEQDSKVVIKAPEDKLKIWFYRYSRLCLATGTDIDEEMVSRARRMLSLAEEGTGQGVSKGSNAFKI